MCRNSTLTFNDIGNNEKINYQKFKLLTKRINIFINNQLPSGNEKILYQNKY